MAAALSDSVAAYGLVRQGELAVVGSRMKEAGSAFDPPAAAAAADRRNKGTRLPCSVLSFLHTLTQGGCCTHPPDLCAK